MSLKRGSGTSAFSELFPVFNLGLYWKKKKFRGDYPQDITLMCITLHNITTASRSVWGTENKQQEYKHTPQMSLRCGKREAKQCKQFIRPDLELIKLWWQRIVQHVPITYTVSLTNLFDNHPTCLAYSKHAGSPSDRHGVKLKANMRGCEGNKT